MKEKSMIDEKDGKTSKSISIEIKDFGPISSGKIALKPLVLFIGPNNSGKSYAALLIHSIYRASLFEKASSAIFSSLSWNDMFNKDILLNNQLYELEQIMEQGKEICVPGEIEQKIVTYITNGIYENGLAKELEDKYSCKLKELVKSGKESFSLKINLGSCNICLTGNDRLSVKKYPHIGTKIILDKALIQLGGTRYWRDTNDGNVSIGMSEIDSDGSFLAALIQREYTLLLQLATTEEGHQGRISHYLPAGRSGILQIYKAVVAGIIKKSANKIDTPLLPEIAAEFISNLFCLPEEQTVFYQLVRELENELINGEIVIRVADGYSPELRYKFHDTDIPLHRSSSTVSELAPLFLYLKYLVYKGDVLIIEEPEAHLHPGNQRILAKFLVRLIRKGIRLIITTHSEYLLEQLSNFIHLSKVDPQKRVEKYSYSKEDYLKYDEIAAYVFDYDKKSCGYKIHPVEVTEKDGISQEEFIRIYDALYDETFSLQSEDGN